MMKKAITLNDGNEMPRPAYGLWQIENAKTGVLIEDAISAGFRHFDTAQAYFNEQGVGNALRNTRVPRESLFVTSKVRGRDMGYSNTLQSFEESLSRLGLDYIDLFLIHWPMPALDLYVETWEALIKLQQEGRIRSIGVSNFSIKHVERIISETGVVPAVNQIELHPYYQQKDILLHHQKAGIAIESYSPFGSNGASVLRNKTITMLADKHGKTPAQIVLRWHLQQDLTPLPRTAKPARLPENIDIWDFDLTEDDMSKISLLDDKYGNTQPHPDEMNMSF